MTASESTSRADTVKPETFGFQTEAKQLLHLMIHSLYSNREVFLRELISNASDAIDKLRFKALEDPSLIEDDPELAIRISVDSENKTVTISDNGIGMSREDVIEHLGTIAKSGTAEFLAKLSGDQAKDSALIGQFGVGFYSSFIVAERVEVITRAAGTSADAATHWTSAGEDEFSIEPASRETRGTDVILHLKSDAEEFADGFRLRNIIRKYADHIGVPVLMLKEDQAVGDEAEEAEEADNEQQDSSGKSTEWETVNEASALWTLPRSEIGEEEYKEFYKHISHDFSDPLTWSHNRVEGKLEYTSLLYIPARAPFDLWNREAPRGLKLYVQRVFIMDEAEQFLPLYLRFVKGIIDSNDLPLNVSREILQRDSRVQSIKSALTKRVLDMLGKLSKKDPETYQTFWQEFGQVLKEGPAEDFSNTESIAKLYRFASTRTEDEKQIVSLEEYVSRMQEGQDKIYYLVAENYETAKHSPHLEVFRKKGIEVLLMYDRIDDWLMNSLREFDGKSFQDVMRGDLELPESDEEKAAEEEQSKAAEGLVERIKTALGDQVAEVRVSHRLVDSPACLVLNEQDMGAQMRHIMEAAGQPVPESKPDFEINPEHALIQKLDHESDEDRFRELSLLIFDQAVLSDGGHLKDPAGYVTRVNQLLLNLLAD